MRFAIRCPLLPSLLILVSLLNSGCGSSSTATTTGVVVSVNNTFPFAEAGGAPVTLTASVSGDPSNQGVTWTLSIANTGCSPACGTLKLDATSPHTKAVYTPPATAPTNNQATITARSMANSQQVFVFNFQIVPPIVVTITNKFSSQTAGGPVANISATITNDVANGGLNGLNWTLTAGGTNCSPACGTLTQDASPALTAHYQPPATPPSGANASPTIAATSVSDPTKSDSFNFNIVAPPIMVTIVNKFTTLAVGGPAVTVNATIANDFTNAGLTWTLTAGGAACSTCGTLTVSAAPSLSVSYTPPATIPAGASATPTITAVSVADNTKSDSFTFTLVGASSLFNGSYALLLRGYDSAGKPLAIAGSITSSGSGSITGGELDINDNGVVTAIPSPLSGSYTLDTSFNGIPRVTITLIVPSGTLVLKGTLSSDGKRGKVIEYDGSFALNAGTLLAQDPAALAAANPAGTYVFGLDSDAGVSAGVTGRVVEAGQVIIGTGGTSVTGGIADAGQAGAANALFGGVSGAAPLDPPPASSGTSPDASGRGTLTLSFAGNVTHYAYYIVSAQQLNLIEIDTGGNFKTVQAGTAQAQKSLTANSINTTSVAVLTGTTVSSGVTAPDVIIGVVTITGGTSAAATFDQNAAGTTHSPSAGTGSILSFDPTTGRSLVANSFFVGALIYLSDAGKGFIIDVTPSQNGGCHAFSGPLIPQAAGPFSAQSDLSGNFIALGGGSSNSSIPNFEMAANFGGASSYSAQGDLATSNTAIGTNGQVANFTVSGGFLIDDATLGHGRFQLLGGLIGDPNAGTTDIPFFYLIGPNQFVAIGQTAGVPSGVLFFDPQ